eukprot:PDM65258.1 hypothetical protein PRIPAC_52200 [Pristionchus pacificus]
MGEALPFEGASGCGEAARIAIKPAEAASQSAKNRQVPHQPNYLVLLKRKLGLPRIAAAAVVVAAVPVLGTVVDPANSAIRSTMLSSCELPVGQPWSGHSLAADGRSSSLRPPSSVASAACAAGHFELHTSYDSRGCLQPTIIQAGPATNESMLPYLSSFSSVISYIPYTSGAPTRSGQYRSHFTCNRREGLLISMTTSWMPCSSTICQKSSRIKRALVTNVHFGLHSNNNDNRNVVLFEPKPS